MSPEQATAEKEITARSDVYSLASVLYEMLTGNPPHTGASAQQIIMKIVTEEAAPVARMRKAVPPNVTAAVAMALEKLPADRFESASAFATALQNPMFTTARAGAAPAPSALPGRSRAVVTLLVATTLVATVSALWGWLRPRPPAPLRQYSMFLPPEQAVSSATPVLGGRLSISPDGARLAYVGGDRTAAGPGIWVRERDRLEATPLSGTSAGRRPFFKPDGSRIGYFGPDGSINVVGLEGEPPRAVSLGPVYTIGGGAWGSDGYIYAVAPSGRDGILRIPEEGGAADPVTVVDTTRGELLHLYPNVLPNGRGVLFTIRGNGTTDRIAVVDMRTGQRNDLTVGESAWYVPSGHLLYLLPDGTLMAAPFDAAALRITGPARTVLAGVGVTRLGADLTLSANGTLMYLSGTAGFGVEPVWVDADGTTAPMDPTWTFASTSIYSTMALSPDGSRLVVSQGTSSGQQLWVKQLPQGPNMQLTFDGRVNSRARWSPDGRSVLFVSDRTGRNQIWRRVADGSAPVELVSAEYANDGLLTADGEWFIYRGMAGDRHIYARRLRGDTATMIVARSERGEDLAPSLSPDGKWIAYVGTESGRNEVYIRPFPEVNRSKTLVSTAGGAEPRWSRDGLALFFRSEADELVRMPVEHRGDTLSFGAPRVLFSTRDFLPLNPFQATYDVAPDGRFVMGRRLATVDGMESEQLIVVENFVDHLQRLMRP
jgi:serine/threonine-protein kinase